MIKLGIILMGLMTAITSLLFLIKTEPKEDLFGAGNSDIKTPEERVNAVVQQIKPVGLTVAASSTPDIAYYKTPTIRLFTGDYTEDEYRQLKSKYIADVRNKATTSVNYVEMQDWRKMVSNEIQTTCNGQLQIQNYDSSTDDLIDLINEKIANNCL